jgi:glycosyltransferase involved in cell wall biosynthesis
VRIAFLTFEYPDVRPGGVGSYVLKCAAALAAAGHEAHIFTLTVPASSRANLPGGVHLHEVEDVAERVTSGSLPAVLGAVALGSTTAAYKLTVGTLLCEKLRWQHRQTPFDIVEAAECDALALPLLLAPIEKLPVVVQIHLGLALNAVANGIPPAQRDELAEALELASTVGADAVCAATRSVVEAYRSLRAFTRDVAIVAHSVQAPATPPTPAPENGAVLFVGRLQKRKGCDVLAAACDIFLRHNPKATVRFAGSDTPTGPGASSMLAEMISRVDPARRDRFVYLGELSQPEVRREIGACRFQVVPSTLENFANTACDAMALGRLVIYGGNTGLDEVVGDAGLCVWPLTAENLAETMETAWNNPTLARDLGMRGYQRVVEKFNPATVTAARIDFYRRVIADHRSSQRQWDALSAGQIRSVLAALVQHTGAPLGLEPAALTPGRMLLSHLMTLAHRLKRPPVVWLFGAGRYTQRLLGEKYLWESAGYTIAGIVDEHPRFQQTPSFLGLPVLTPQQLCDAARRGQQVDAVVLSTDTLDDVFHRRAQGLGEMGIEIISISSSAGREV